MVRHRIVSGTGLGNPDKELLDNKGKINIAFAEDAINKYFSAWKGLDYKINKDEILVGIEPAYQYEKLLILSICANKNKSYLRRGIAWGGYGSDIASSIKFYSGYKRKCKFTNFIDKWHPILFKKERRKKNDC